MKRRVFYTLVILVAALLFFLRFYELGHLEPRIDQAYFARWVQDLNRADYFLPHADADATWLGGLERDSRSFAHHLGRRIYSGSHHALQLVTLGVYVISVALFDDSYGTQVAVSVLGSVAILIVLGCFPLWVSRCQDRVTFGHGAWVGFTAMGIAGFALYLHHFSGWGVHNYGVAFSLLATAVVSRFLRTENGSGFTAAGFASALALFSHYTNVLLISPAIFLALATNAEWPLRRRVGFAIRFLIIFLICAFPVVVLGGILGSFGESVSYATRAHVDSSLSDRFVSWFVTGSDLFSWPGVLLGIVGNAAVFQLYRIRMPAMILGPSGFPVGDPNMLWFGMVMKVPGFTGGRDPTHRSGNRSPRGNVPGYENRGPSV